MTNSFNAAGRPAGNAALLNNFPPTHQAALDRLASVNPTQYARTRNALDGSVTRLSPYFTHGLLSLKDAARSVHQRHPLSYDDKLVFEFGWRAFFHHVWSHAKNGGDAITQDMHGDLPWPGRYSQTLPLDIREGRTGVAVIDNTVRALYSTGYLHNHARMWLASYVVHVRKVHWRAGADWLYGHLLDGDLPSNHLSWQWVAGTFSSKPYLFNAENVSKYAPAHERRAWDCSGTVIDTSYEDMDTLTRQKGDAGCEPGEHDKVAELPLFSSFESFMPVAQQLHAQQAIDLIANKHVELVHPWALAPRSAGSTVRIGIIHLPAHADWPWSERRWRFVLEAMAQVTDGIWAGDITKLNLEGALSVTAQATLFPHYRQALARVAKLTESDDLLPSVNMPCKSFSKFYERARRGVSQFSDLL